MQPREIINTTEFNLVIKRLAFQLIENHTNFEDTVLIGLQSRGVCLSDRLQQVLQEINPELKILNVGYLDITFYRDDFLVSIKPLIANELAEATLSYNTKKPIVLVDDVL